MISIFIFNFIHLPIIFKYFDLNRFFSNFQNKIAVSLLRFSCDTKLLFYHISHQLLFKEIFERLVTMFRLSSASQWLVNPRSLKLRVRLSVKLKLKFHTAAIHVKNRHHARLVKSLGSPTACITFFWKFL